MVMVRNREKKQEIGGGKNILFWFFRKTIMIEILETNKIVTVMYSE